MVRGEGEPAAYFRELLRFLIHTARADEAAVWLRTGDDAWTRIGQALTHQDGTPTSESIATPPGWIVEVLQSHGMTVSRYTTETQSGQRIVGPIQQAGAVTGVLAVQFHGDVLPLPASTFLPFCEALSELTGDLLVQHELRRLRREQQERLPWERWETALSTATRLPQLAGVLAHDGRALCQVDRITVLQATGSRWRAMVVSGVDVLDPRSSTLQALEKLAGQALSHHEPRGFSIHETAGSADTAWQDLVTAAGTQEAFLVPLHHPRSGRLGAIIAERFSTSASPADTWKLKVLRLATTVTPWWAALAEAERSLWNRWFVRQRTDGTTGSRTRLWWVAAGLAVVLALVLIPAPLIVPAEGELLPVERRDVFATANGIVESVTVRHGDLVTREQPLLVLRDPAIELEAARVTGELATVRTRLSTVRAARITLTSSGIEAAQRTQQLAAEEEDLQQQSESLTRQKLLLDKEQASWELTSPIAGQVLTWDVETLLAGRPVERGQVLLSVGNTAGDWEIAAQVRERDVGHLFADAADPQGRSVEFAFSTAAGQTLTGRVTGVSQVAEINERGESTVRVSISFDREQATQLRPGVSVWTRIRCGNHALGYVWFHDAIDALRRQFWLWR